LKSNLFFKSRGFRCKAGLFKLRIFNSAGTEKYLKLCLTLVKVKKGL